MGWFMNRWTPPPPPPSLPKEEMDFPTPPEGIRIRDVLARLDPLEIMKRRFPEAMMYDTFTWEASPAQMGILMLPGWTLDITMKLMFAPKMILHIRFVSIPQIEDELDTNFKWEIPKPVNIKKENV